MLFFLIRFVNRFRPREGWAPFLLTLVALLCPAAALIEANSDLGAERLLVLTVLAAIIGLRLARSRLSARGALILGALLGGGLVPVVVGRLLPPWSLIWRESLYTARWWELAQGGVVGHPLPFASAARFSWQRLNDLGTRLWWWGQTVVSGGAAQDTIVFLLLAAFLSWAFGLFATWQVYRRRTPLVGLLPGGASVAILVFFHGGQSTLYLIAYLFCTLWLLAICHLWTHRDRWEQAGTDYPDNLGLELMLALAPWIVLFLLLAVVFPVIRPRQVADAFWKLMTAPWSAVEQVSDRLFGPIDRGGSAGPGSGRPGFGGSLPRARLLGAGPELEEMIVFYVATNDPAPPLPEPDEPGVVQSTVPRRYWRSVTYDTYTGRGWTNSSLEQRTSPPDQPLDPSLPPGFELRQQFDRVTSEGEQVYAANAPLWIDHPVQTWWRAPGDLAQISSQANRYTVISRPPEPSIADLRAASSTLPPELAERYLALPDGIPQRVLDLTEVVVGGTETRYERARSIELFLRTYTYSLDLPPPPGDRDVVDYFLFDVQQGYCDYYASAMVVMARAAGLPARFATGYAQGAYDPDQKRWVVTEKDGHSWVEVYFDGIGWVEFEPTAGLPALDRPGGDSPAITVPPLPPRTAGGHRVPWILAALMGFLISLVSIIAWVWRSQQHRVVGGAALVRDRQARLLRWGARLGYPLRNGQTSREYGDSLSTALCARGQCSRWAWVRRAGVKAVPEIKHLTETFIRTQYSTQPITPHECSHIRQLWTSLRRRLWWLWLGPR